MEKKRTNFFILAKLTFTAIFLLLMFSTHAQKLETFKNYCGRFYKSMAGLLKMQQKEIGFYDFKSGQTIASIGAQCGHWEAAYAAATDSVTFYLEDVDSNKPMLTNEETNALFEKNGFEYVDGIDFNYRQKNSYKEIFAFRIKN